MNYLHKAFSVWLLIASSPLMATPIEAQLSIKSLSHEDKELILEMPEIEVKNIFNSDQKVAEIYGVFASLLTGKSLTKPYFGMSGDKKHHYNLINLREYLHKISNELNYASSVANNPIGEGTLIELSNIKLSSRKNTCTASPILFVAQPGELHKIEIKCFYNKKQTREIHADMLIAYSTDYTIRNTKGTLLKASLLDPAVKQTQLSIDSDFLHSGKRNSIEATLKIKPR